MYNTIKAIILQCILLVVLVVVTSCLLSPLVYSCYKLQLWGQKFLFTLLPFMCGYCFWVLVMKLSRISTSKTVKCVCIVILSVLIWGPITVNGALRMGYNCFLINDLGRAKGIFSETVIASRINNTSLLEFTWPIRTSVYPDGYTYKTRDGSIRIIRPNGEYIAKYSDGTIAGEVTYDWGVRNGKYIIWDSNGVLRVEGWYTDGIPCCRWKVYDTKGNYKAIGTLGKNNIDKWIYYVSGEEIVGEFSVDRVGLLEFSDFSDFDLLIERVDTP